MRNKYYVVIEAIDYDKRRFTITFETEIIGLMNGKKIKDIQNNIVDTYEIERAIVVNFIRFENEDLLNY